MESPRPSSSPSKSPGGGPQEVEVGRIGRPYGVRGWVHVHSSMDPPQALSRYAVWLLSAPRAPGPGRARSAFESGSESRSGAGWTPRGVAQSRVHRGGLVVRLCGCTDREGAARLTGRTIALAREALPEPDEDEYYWTDLIGLEVMLESGVRIGRVDALIETGANDVLVVTGGTDCLIPFVLGDVVTRIDLRAGRLWVDWNPGWDISDGTGAPGMQPE